MYKVLFYRSQFVGESVYPDGIDLKELTEVQCEKSTITIHENWTISSKSCRSFFS